MKIGITIHMHKPTYGLDIQIHVRIFKIMIQLFWVPRIYLPVYIHPLICTHIYKYRRTYIQVYKCTTSLAFITSIYMFIILCLYTQIYGHTYCSPKMYCPVLIRINKLRVSLS